MTTERLYRTGTTLERTLRVAYPAGRGRVVLRTERDWERDIEPDIVSDDRNTSTFTIRADQPFLYFKACLVGDQGRHWSVGPNKLLLMAEDDQRDVTLRSRSSSRRTELHTAARAHRLQPPRDA